MLNIVTKFYGATDHKGGRITARCELGQVTVPHHPEMDVYDAHLVAVDALRSKYDLGEAYPTGGGPRGFWFVA